MSFLSIATPFVALGIPVFPLTPKTKIPPSGFHFLEEATIDPKKVASWNEEDPDYNVALLANGEFCFLEFDVAKGMSAAAAEMEHEIPLTRTQVSGKGFGITSSVILNAAMLSATVRSTCPMAVSGFLSAPATNTWSVQAVSTPTATTTRTPGTLNLFPCPTGSATLWKGIPRP
jgi:hypothetical protein